MTLQDSLQLFWRLGIDVPALPRAEFTKAYCELAKRYHPDVGDQQTQDLMANINLARAKPPPGLSNDLNTAPRHWQRRYCSPTS